MLEQKAEWLSFGQTGGLFNKEGNEKLQKRTRDSKTILIYGSRKEFDAIENEREKEIKLDTFELFRRDNRNLEILTYDELFDRAEFIVKNKKW